MTKKQQLENPQSTLSRTGDDEPIFVIRARDIDGHKAVWDWCDRAKNRGVSNDKIDEAYIVADEMIKWKSKFGCKIPD